MELMQLEMLVATVEEGGMRKAAGRVSRTQAAVSMALRKLEEEIGTKNTEGSGEASTESDDSVPG